MLRSILFVDDEPSVLDALRRALHRHRRDWELHFAQSADEALALVHSTRVDVVVTDVTMPGRDGLSLLSALRAECPTEIPVIILTGLDDIDLKRRALELGAIDLLNKPIVPEDLVARLHSVLRLKEYQDQLRDSNELLERKVRQRTSELERSRIEIIWRLAKAGEYRDEQTGNHVVRVGACSRALADQLGMSRDFVDTIFLTSPLHDIGKIGVSDTILHKNGPLSGTERRLMQRHCEIGYELLQHEPAGLADLLKLCSASRPHKHAAPNPLLQQAATIALTHHEQWGGGGYPRALRGEQIPLEGRLVAVADVYDALSHARPYKRAFTEEEVFAVMKEEAPWHFDPEAFAAFEKIRSAFGTIRHDLADSHHAAA
jgi:putative two-component system response regulator